MSLIGELALSKGIDVLFRVLQGAASSMWATGPVGRVLVLLRQDFGAETGLGSDDFFAWQQDEAIASLLTELTTGRLLPGPDAQRRLEDAIRPKLYRVPEEARDDFARRIAQAAQQAAPLVLEGGQVAQLLANLMLITERSRAVSGPADGAQDRTNPCHGSGGTEPLTRRSFACTH